METGIGKLVVILFALAAIIAIGVSGYHFLEGWAWFDSLYMTVITLASVGYGETHPLSPAGRGFTILLILGGIGVLTFAITSVTTFIIEGDFKEVLRRKHMKDKVQQLTGHYIICGAGQVGHVIIDELRKTGRSFVVVEKDPATVQELLADGLIAIAGDATNEQVLERAGIAKARGLFGALPSDQGNIFVALTAKELNPELRIVTTQEGRGIRKQFTRSGVDAVVHPGFIGGMRMASEMIRPAAVGFLDQMLRSDQGVLRIEEIGIPENSAAVGNPLESLIPLNDRNVLLLAVRDPVTREYRFNPDRATVVAAGEILVVMGERAALNRLETAVA